MDTFITSDLHLGSPFSRAVMFEEFLGTLPEEATLVLNGDTVDARKQPFPDTHRRVLDRIRQESLRRRVIWVRGNHDERFAMDDPGRLEFVTSWSLEKRLLVCHGYDFDTLTAYHKPLVILLRIIHAVRTRMGAESVHITFFIRKRFGFFYRVLRRHVAMNAVAYARENGYAAVTCGHTHGAEDVMIDGIRYINTGGWTDLPAHRLRVNASTMILETIRENTTP